MPNRSSHHKVKLDEHSNGSCHVNPASYHEIFISANRLISIYNEKMWHPPTDIFETDTDIIVRCEIAGMKPEEISVQLNGNRLIVSGCRNERDARAKRNFRQMQIEYGKFERIVEVNCGVEAAKASASYKDGFLEVVLPRMAPLKSGKKTQGEVTIKQIIFIHQ